MNRILLLILFLIFSSELYSAGLAVKGSYRTRGNSFRNLHFDSNRETGYRNYIDQRFRLNTVFVANDLILVRSDIDFLANCAGHEGSSFGCMMGAGSPGSDSNPSGRGFLNRWVGRGSGETLHAKRLWAEINTKYGILVVGRQPDSWGTGIYANSGDGLWDNYGDSLDRILFDMKYGSVTFAPFYGNFSEQELDSTNDYYEMGLKIKYHMVDTKNIYGLYIALRSSRDHDNRLATYDLFADHNFGALRLELELVFQNGRLAGEGLDAAGVLARVQSEILKRFTVGLEVGSASGDDTADPGYGQFSFSPDFRPALILFAHEFGNAPFRMGGRDDSGASFDYPACVHNAIYIKPAVTFRYGNSKIDGAFLWAQRPYGDRRSDNKSLGYEIDFSYSYRSSEILIFGADLGFFFPGDYFETLDSVAKDLTFAMMGTLKVGVRF